MRIQYPANLTNNACAADLLIPKGYPEIARRFNALQAGLSHFGLSARRDVLCARFPAYFESVASRACASSFNLDTLSDACVGVIVTASTD
jgi:hypothetical protein